MNSYNVNTNSLFWLSVFCLVISLSFKVVLEIKFYHQIVNSYYQILKVPILSIQLLLLFIAFRLVSHNAQKITIKIPKCFYIVLLTHPKSFIDLIHI